MARTVPTPFFEAWGPEHWSPSQPIPRHRHRRPYAAVVLSGCYEEAGDEGRRRVSPGDVLFHDAFDAHRDRIGPQGARTLNLPVADYPPPLRAGRVADLDLVARTAEADPLAAAALLLERLERGPAPEEDWPDLLARELARAGARLDRWARAHNLSPATVSRGFRAVYGVSPAVFRAEARARRAWRRVVDTDEPLAQTALATQHADQSHMTRAVLALTGETPAGWRRQFASRRARVHPVARQA